MVAPSQPGRGIAFPGRKRDNHTRVRCQDNLWDGRVACVPADMTRLSFESFPVCSIALRRIDTANHPHYSLEHTENILSGECC
jgi:hypothetical protein